MATASYRSGRSRPSTNPLLFSFTLKDDMMILDVVAMVAITATDVVMGAELNTATAAEPSADQAFVL